MSAGVIPMAQGRPRVLFTSPILRYPPNGGPSLRVANSIRALNRVSILEVFHSGTWEEIGGGAAEEFLRASTAAFAVENSKGRGIGRLARSAAYRMRNLSSAVQSYFGRRLAVRVAEEARCWRADVVWLGYGNISYPLLREIKGRMGIPVVVDTDSIWSRFMLRGLDVETDPIAREEVEASGRAKAEEEAWGTDLADATTAVSEVDASYYRALIADPRKVFVFSNVVDIDAYGELVSPPPDFRRPSILLSGTFWKKSPMEDAARWFVSEILPLVRVTFPYLHLYIVGRGSLEIVRDLSGAGVTVTGEILSVVPYLRNVDVVAVPLRFESGTRFKILEAGACGRAVVSTTLGAEGLPVVQGENALVADDPAAFASALCELLSDRAKAEKMGSSLESLVRGQFDIEAASRQAAVVLDFVTRSRRTLGEC